MILSELSSSAGRFIPTLVYRKNAESSSSYDKQPMVFNLKYLDSFINKPVTNAELYLDNDGETVNQIVYYTIDFNNHIYRHELSI